MSRCQLCDATVEWKTTPSGLRIPVDPTPNAAGPLRLLANGCVQIIPVEHRDSETRPRYTSHWMTCPAAAEAKAAKGKARDEP